MKKILESILTKLARAIYKKYNLIFTVDVNTTQIQVYGSRFVITKMDVHRGAGATGINLEGKELCEYLRSVKTSVGRKR